MYRIRVTEAMKKHVCTVREEISIGECIKVMAAEGFRRLPVVGRDKKLLGIVTATDIVNYFGGGGYYSIIEVKYKGDFESALEEPVSSIMTRGVIKVGLEEDLSEVLKKMGKFKVGGLPVVSSDGKVLGIITEMDVLSLLIDKVSSDLKVKDVMVRDIVTIEGTEPLKNLARKIIDCGVRRLPVIYEGEIWGIASTMDVVRYLASSEPFRHMIIGLVEEVMNVRVISIVQPGVVSVDPSSSIREAYRIMTNEGVDFLIVMVTDKLRGIVTERDLLSVCIKEGM
ncbi:MAG: hypothetical protein DRJ63_10220 [Thermoprotei archaeon]|nr:MAG: hypothetical protein DRJ63_10220 [Thermoprotei archaeon]